MNESLLEEFYGEIPTGQSLMEESLMNGVLWTNPNWVNSFGRIPIEWTLMDKFLLDELKWTNF